MRTLLFAVATLGLLAGAPGLASAAEAGTPQATVATSGSTGHANLLHRWFARVRSAQARENYGDPFDAGRVKPNQVIVVPVGA